jgi:hypothetical protein
VDPPGWIGGLGFEELPRGLDGPELGLDMVVKVGFYVEERPCRK